MELQKIIDPVDINLIKAELTPAFKLGNTNKGGNEIYDVTWKDAPNTIREIGRLREIAYREAGASSGKELDLDEYDLMENPYHQLIVWDPDAEAIIGGYRYILGSEVKLRENGQPVITASHLYKFSDIFIKEYLPHTMELGRSFVTPEYQSSKAGAKAIFTMDNLWDGIAFVILNHPDVMYFFGKMTIYPTYNKDARNLIIHFLNKHFEDKDNLIRPYNPIEVSDNPDVLNLILCEDDLKKDLRLLKEAVRKLGTSIPPLVNSYINASATMKILGSAINDELGNAIETGLMICFNEMYSDKVERHMDIFIKNHIETLNRRFPNLTQHLEERIRRRIEYNRKRTFQAFQKKRKAPLSISPDIELH